LARHWQLGQPSAKALAGRAEVQSSGEDSWLLSLPHERSNVRRRRPNIVAPRYARQIKTAPAGTNTRQATAAFP
jgi:hypothetical protein